MTTDAAKTTDTTILTFVADTAVGPAGGDIIIDADYDIEFQKKDRDQEASSKSTGTTSTPTTTSTAMTLSTTIVGEDPSDAEGPHRFTLYSSHPPTRPRFESRMRINWIDCLRKFLVFIGIYLLISVFLIVGVFMLLWGVILHDNW